ncbi:hypothetical protein EVG20_g2676 [Dentipellis fragilis]|uniref:Prolyl 4-hydroxylase alpha subunit Fe(2+) 2OG dioxygenase domain-containing protein n=1 Tax=Dentipellis fragilis TaxID=205917 RepID=A0A4Y9ZAA4_9AGAM|nr:hypothetical protein EVG20_g2676 [Dentipellis fragilis]
MAADELDIRADLEHLSRIHKTDLNAAFSFHGSYADAPNPILNLSNLGIVGLPLGTRDAEAIKRGAIQAASGTRQQTAVDTRVRERWGIDGKLVTFLNPVWNTYISRVIREVCQTLGVNVEGSRPRAELHKLFLYETGSHFLPHIDAEEANGMFASIVVILPSVFTGGVTHLTHGGLSAIHDIAPTSLLNTTVIAWYTNVQYEIKPITSGYHLALSYNLMHTTTSLRPALSINHEVVKKFAAVLQAWAHDDSDRSPEKIIFLLNYQYSDTPLKGSALEGADAHKLALLSGLAQKHGFSLGLATARCRLIGSADESDRDDDEWGRRHGSCGTSDDTEDKVVDFAMIDDRELTIEHFVDVEGKPIREHLAFEDNETIPEDLTEDLEFGECDEEEYDKYCGSLTRLYLRTVLVIWPNRDNFWVIYQGPDGFKRACDTLESCMHTSKNEDLAEFILARNDTNSKRAAEVVCRAGYNGVSTLPEGNAAQVLDLFMWEDVRESFELMLKHDRYNASRLKFLKLLADWALNTEDGNNTEDEYQFMGAKEHQSAIPAEVLAWVSVQIPEVLKTLRTPRESESKFLLDAAKGNGGMAFLKDSMLPQLLLSSEPSFLLSFVYALFAFEDFPQSSEKAFMISTILKQAISKETFHAMPPSHPTWPYYTGGQTAKVPAVPTAENYISACFAVGCPNRVSDIIDRITDVSSLSAQQAQKCAKDLLLPLVAYCANLMITNSEIESVNGLEKLQHIGIQLHLDWVRENPDVLTKEEFTKLLNAAVLKGDPRMLSETVIPKLQATKLSVPALRVIVEGTRQHRARFVFPCGDTGAASLDLSIKSFAEQYILRLPLPAPHVIISALDWCLYIEHPELYQKIIARFLDPPKMDKAYINNLLIPLLPAFRDWAVKINALDTFAFVFQRVLLRWLQKILGPPPAPNPTLASQIKELDKWTCTCHVCHSARSFLQENQAQRTLTLDSLGAPTRKHLEVFLSAHTRGLATFSTIKKKPQGSTITKSHALHQFSSWKAVQQEGVRILNRISTDDGRLRRLLGSQYSQIVAAIKGNTPALQPALPTPVHNLPAGLPPLARPTMGPASSSQSTANGRRTTNEEKEDAASGLERRYRLNLDRLIQVTDV